MTDEIERKRAEIGDKIYAPTTIEPEKTKAIGDGLVECTVTTPKVDRYNESITTDGIDIKDYLANPTVLYGHDYNSLPIGKAINIQLMKTKLKSTTQFAVDEYEFAKTCYLLVKGGYLNDVSIGLIVNEWSPDYSTILQSSMIEYSHVNIGANVDGKVTARAYDPLIAIGKSFDQVKEEWQDFAQRTIADRIKQIPYDDVNQSIQVLKNLVGALEASVQPMLLSGDDKPEVRRIKRIALRDTAKAVATQGERVIRTIKIRETTNGRHN